MSNSDRSHSTSQSLLVGVLSHSKECSGNYLAAREKEKEHPYKRFLRSIPRTSKKPVTLPTFPFDHRDGEA